jgi:hypothetical protein
MDSPKTFGKIRKGFLGGNETDRFDTVAATTVMAYLARVVIMEIYSRAKLNQDLVFAS